MVEYNCSLCNYKTNIKSHYNRHLATMKHKKNANERDEKEPRITTYNHAKPRITTEGENETKRVKNNNKKYITPKKHSLDTNKKLQKCDYCLKYSSKKMFKRHLREYCIYIPENKRKALIEKYNNDKRNKNKQLAIQNSDITTNNNSTVNNIVNNQNINNGNIINNNITIKINPLGKEDLSFLTNKDKIDILKHQHMGVPELIKRVHSHPSNMNFFLPNINKKMIAYLDVNNKLKYDNYDEVCMQIIDDNVGRFDDIFNEFGDELNKKIKKRIEQVIEANGNDMDINKKYIEDIKYNIINWSKEFKTTLNDYVNQLTENYI